MPGILQGLLASGQGGGSCGGLHREFSKITPRANDNPLKSLESGILCRE
jgi:hypothetical protein